jgi:uncharacterized protein YbaR (Trm112 family)
VSEGIADWLDVVGCPECKGALRLTDDGALVCAPREHWFAIKDGVPALVRSRDVKRLTSFSHDYREARCAEGRRPLTSAQALKLPYGSPPGYPPLYWEVRRQSYQSLMHSLIQLGFSPEGGAAVDVGAGIGWLAFRLAQAGYRTLAVEASLDLDFGLGASQVYRSAAGPGFLAVQGDLERPPLRSGAVGLTIFNASLHYARDLEGTLRRVGSALRPGGCLAILDTPISRQPRSGSGQGDRHLSREELSAALSAAGLNPQWIPVRRGWRWWLYQAKARFKRSPLFSFPLVLGLRQLSSD